MASQNQDSASYEASAEVKQKFESILVRNGITDQVDTVIITEPAHLKGEHFATSTVYVTINFKGKMVNERNLFLKRFASGEFLTESLKRGKIMEKEAEFYNTFLPACKEFCKEFGFENLLNFFPTCFYADDEMIVLENLCKEKGFVMLDKEQLQDLDTAKIVLENLAKFHAVTYALQDNCGRDAFLKKWELLRSEVFFTAERAPQFSKLIGENGITTCITILKGGKVPGYVEAVEKLEALLGKSFDKIIECVRFTAQDKLLVVNLGDCQNNNMLFTHELSNGKKHVKDHVFVDLQVPRLASPCADILYYLYTSVKTETRTERLRELLILYFSVFQTTLCGFGKKSPVNFDGFMDDFKKRSYYGYVSHLGFLSIVGALKDVDIKDFGTTPDEMVAAFVKIMDNWMQKNPEKVESISHKIFALMKEYEALIA